MISNVDFTVLKESEKEFKLRLSFQKDEQEEVREEVFTPENLELIVSLLLDMVRKEIKNFVIRTTSVKSSEGKPSDIDVEVI